MCAYEPTQTIFKTTKMTASNQNENPSRKRLEFTSGMVASQCAFSTAFYPLTMGKTLIQMGYEPLKPVPIKTIFGTPKLAYPNIFKYLNYIRQEDGFFGLYRGLGYKLMLAVVERGVYVLTFNQMEEHLMERLRERGKDETKDSDEKKQEKKKESTEDQIMVSINDCMCEVLCRSITLAATYPLQVMMVRSIAEFVGRENIYNNLPTYISRLFQESNFYAGFMPKLLSEVYNILMFNTIKFAIVKVVNNAEFREYVNRSISMLLNSLLYPYDLCSTVMAVNSCSSLLASRIEPPFPHWTNCYRSLAHRGQLKRGSALIWRYMAITHIPNN